MPRGLVRQHDLGLRGTAGQPNDPGQRRERLPVMLTGAAQRRVEVRRRTRSFRDSRNRLVAVGARDVAPLRPGPRRAGSSSPSDEREWISTRMSLSSPPGSAASSAGCGSSSGSICSTSSWPTVHGVNRQAERFAGGGQGDLGEARGRHDGLAVHLVVGQPGQHVGSDVRLPHVIAAGGQFDVRAEQRMGAGQLPSRRAVRDPERGMCCHGVGGMSTRRPAGRSGAAPRRWPSRWVWKKRVSSGRPVHRRRDEHALGGRPGCR